MDRLHAPWRMEYIESDKTEGCFLCDALNGNDDPKHLILYRDDDIFVILNKYPYNNGHLMIVPKDHVADIEDCDDDILRQMMVMTKKMKNVLNHAMHPEGFNIGINLGRVAGAGLPTHFHLHIVPRWNGDTNFMPVLSDTRVMPEYLNETYNRLHTMM